MKLINNRHVIAISFIYALMMLSISVMFAGLGIKVADNAKIFFFSINAVAVVVLMAIGLRALWARDDFQRRVKPWMGACFGPEISGDKQERNHRFLEEALELVQACNCTVSEAHQLVDYVYGRPIGDKPQEVGGVMVTLAALCLAQKMDMHDAGEVELDRIWTKVEQIREKQAAKPKHCPLPQ